MIGIGVNYMVICNGSYKALLLISRVAGTD